MQILDYIFNNLEKLFQKKTEPETKKVKCIREIFH